MENENLPGIEAEDVVVGCAITDNAVIRDRRAIKTAIIDEVEQMVRARIRRLHFALAVAVLVAVVEGVALVLR